MNMKTNIASIFAAATLALFTASCANEETTKPEANPEAPAAGMTFVGGSAVKTRTSLDVTLPGGTTVDYFWEPNDKIWTADNATGTAQITSKSATANFRMSKSYTTSTVEVYYPGQNASAYNQVTIATNQTQTEPNSTKHLGAAGDCGTATAHKQSDNSYKFDLDHKASYLCLLPRTPNGLVSTYITQVKITSDNNIAGTYTLTPTGLTGSGSSNTITITTSGSSHPNGFPLNNAATSQSTNAVYAVIAPGTHAFTIEYTFKDIVTNVGTTLTKTIASTNYVENTVYPLTANLQLTEYPGNGYYTWDADAGQHYWAGYEWNGATPKQPTVNGQVNNTDAPANTAKSATNPRGYNGVAPYSDPTGTAPAVTASNSAAGCPNANELIWYCFQGEPHWDSTTLWATMGHLYVGGMWFKKQSSIAAAQTPSKTIADLKAAAPDGTDYTRSINFPSPNSTSFVTQGKPANLSDYFYLPALGAYNNGMIGGIGTVGTYWSNIPCRPSWYSTDAYVLQFVNNLVGVYKCTRDTGCRLWTAQ